MQTEQLQFYDDSMMSHGSLSIVMGTKFDIILLGKSKVEAENIWSQVVVELQRLDKMLNRFDPTSEVSRLNRKAFESPFEVSDELWSILNDCRKYYEMTGGIFDVTLNDFSSVKFYEETNFVSFLDSDVSLDFGGYAKGYALEKVKIILQNEQVENAFVDFGNSSIMALGRHPYGDSWKVSIENPFDPGKVLGEFSLEDSTLTTSGNTPEYSTHIVNPISGKRIETKQCVCVVASNARDGEVLSTALIAATEQKKQEIISQFNVEKILEFNLNSS